MTFISVRQFLKLQLQFKALEKKMSQFDNDLARLQAAETKLAVDLPLISGGIADLNANLATLTAQLADAGLTADQQAALDAAVSSAETLETQAAALGSAFAPPPAPAPAPAPAS
jgi:hypothetical protein